jgi:hypothetical protein
MSAGLLWTDYRPVLDVSVESTRHVESRLLTAGILSLYWLTLTWHYPDIRTDVLFYCHVLTFFFTRLFSSSISMPGSHVGNHETFCRLHKLKVHHRVHSITPQDLYLSLVLTRLWLRSQTRLFICWYNCMDWRCFIDRCWEYVLELRGRRQQEVRWGVSPDITWIMRLAGHVARI